MEDCQVHGIECQNRNCKRALINVTIGNHRCVALADAGATISLINSHLAKDLGLKISKSYIRATGVTNDTLDIVGQTKANIEVAGQWCTNQTLYVTRGLSRSMILGTDSMSQLGEITYDFQSCTFRVNNGPAIPMGKEAVNGVVMTVEEVVVPPLSELAVLVQLPPSSVENGYCVFEGNKSTQPCTFIGKSLSRISNRKIHVPVLNPTKRFQTIAKHAVVGSIETLEDDIKIIAIPTDPEKKNGEENVRPGDKMDINNTNLNTEQFKTLQELVNEFADIAGEGIGDLGRTTVVEHVIETMPGSMPVRSKPYNVPVGIRHEVKKQIDQMLEKGLISPSSGEWTSPIVLVRKKDGNWRFCVDYRKLNAMTIPQNMAMSSIDSATEIMHGKQYFSSIDLCSGFFQVSLHKDSRIKSGFISPFGCYEFNVMAQGLKSSPATFTRLALALNSDLMASGKAACYLDDWIMTSNTFEEHIEILRTVFSRLRFAGLKYRPSKSQLCQKELLYLGHIISKDGMTVAPHNTEKIRKFPTPKNRTEVKRLLGLFGYYRAFIKGFSKIAAPIIKLTSQKVEFNWTQECEEATEFLRTQITSAPILAFPDFSQPFILTTDASTTSLGAVLSQMQNGKKHPISYYSRTLNSSESKWESFERELYAIVCAVKHYKGILLNHKFEIRTDNSACTHVLTTADLKPKIARWAVQLGEYDYNVTHKPGRQNLVADALSRAEITTVDSSQGCDNLVEQEMREDQKRDFYLGPIWRYIVKEKYPKDATKAQKHAIAKDSNDFVVKNKVLYRLHGDKVLLAIPAKQRSLLLYSVHESLNAMHPGVTKTLQRIKDRYWFPKMYQAVEDYIRECPSCQHRKNPQSKRVPLGTFLAKTPFETVSVDFLGPFTTSSDGYKHILVFTDHFTKWCVIVPTKDQLTTTVAQVYIERVFCVFGASKRLLSDRGKTFMSKLMTEVNKKLSVKQKHTTPYHPQCNGQVEIYNKTIANMLSHFTDPVTQKDWSQYVPFVQLCINSSKHSI